MIKQDLIDHIIERTGAEEVCYRAADYSALL